MYCVSDRLGFATLEEMEHCIDFRDYLGWVDYWDWQARGPESKTAPCITDMIPPLPEAAHDDSMALKAHMMAYSRNRGDSVDV